MVLEPMAHSLNKPLAPRGLFGSVKVMAALDIKPLAYEDVGRLYNVRTTVAQEDFVAPNGITMGQAPFEPGSEVFGLWEGDAPVGLLAIIDMTHPQADITEGHDRDGIFVWRLLVGAEAQGRGIGRAAMNFAIDVARTRGRSHVAVSCVEAPGSAIGFYEGLGFTKTGKMLDDDEYEMVLYFKDNDAS